ncbi:hypothetical protein CN676_03995 [Bacillus wiedmannii]|uniref:hypothetical protein n=1 Tax=Bacillus wiedmannii TaxID=1890302 RepID=UPI000BEDC4EC|nr:hypothetical protein [Bacillus wiedmannii]PEA79112.1 hypothetical protein CON92_00650 [Bacillus wiedmannii]PEG08482.1 hypothetical protein CON96_21890 [Bacillus wiedmannii]PEJ55816.1 hypothetical protein CN676_03995 [Bacillus wiedmannii]PHA68235.1 hypothetical protein COE75_03195 [Bacillus wiedmannii]
MDKFIGPIITLLIALITNAIAFYQFRIKFKTFNEFDKLFLNKSEQKKLTDFQFLSDWFLLFFAMYLMPLIAFYQFEKPSHNWSLYLGTFGLLFMMISICCFVPVFIYAFQKDLPVQKYSKARKWGLANMILSLIWFYPISYLVVTSKSWLAMPAIILFALLYSLFLNLVANQTKKKPSTTEYLVDILTEEELKQTPLIHAYIIDDKKSVLYHGGDLSRKTFYVCDFSSKIYLKYTPFQELDINTNELRTENVSQ